MVEAVTDEARLPTPALDALEARFRTSSPVFREAVERARRTHGEPWAAAFDEFIARVLPDDVSIAAAVSGYSRFALEALRLQAKFEKTGAYEPRSYADVSASVYADEEYMTSCYLPGLVLSNYLWPHHYRQLRFFEEAFVAVMAHRAPDMFYDVGVGTGIYSRVALGAWPRTTGIGIDISPSSKAFAERHVAAFGLGHRYSVELRDIVDRPVHPVQSLVCVEVLEHLEDPEPFLAALRSMLQPGGRAFIGTALNAANADHIYLYRTPDEVRAQLARAGFSVEQYLCAAAGPPREPTMPVPEVAGFVVT